jgi:hypothetical protein
MSLFSIVQNAVPVPVPAPARSPETVTPPERPTRPTGLSVPVTPSGVPLPEPTPVEIPRVAPTPAPSPVAVTPSGIPLPSYVPATTAPNPPFVGTATLPSPVTIVPPGPASETTLPGFQTGGTYYDSGLRPRTTTSASTTSDVPTSEYVGTVWEPIYRAEFRLAMIETGGDPAAARDIATGRVRLRVMDEERAATQGGSDDSVLWARLAQEARQMELQHKMALMEEERQRRIAEWQAQVEAEKARQQWFENQQALIQKQRQLGVDAASQVQNFWGNMVRFAVPGEPVTIAPQLLTDWVMSSSAGRQPSQYYPVPQYPGLSLPGPAQE